mmetsp:Transcript_1608/g.4835  ORF Transcript_1608/g.4835 Transcript_1608/m.4835 type:complete len:292 (+) Transcript_1608:223-1098(+)
MQRARGKNRSPRHTRGHAASETRSQKGLIRRERSMQLGAKRRALDQRSGPIRREAARAADALDGVGEHRLDQAAKRLAAVGRRPTLPNRRRRPRATRGHELPPAVPAEVVVEPDADDGIPHVHHTVHELLTSPETRVCRLVAGKPAGATREDSLVDPAAARDGGSEPGTSDDRGPAARVRQSVVEPLLAGERVEVGPQPDRDGVRTTGKHGAVTTLELAGLGHGVHVCTQPAERQELRPFCRAEPRCIFVLWDDAGRLVCDGDRGRVQALLDLEEAGECWARRVELCRPPL